MRYSSTILPQSRVLRCLILSQVLKAMNDLTEKLNEFCNLRCLLLPLAKHVAMVYCILVQLEESNPLYAQSWEQFEGLFKNTLSLFIKKHPTFGKEKSNEVVDAAIELINQAILQDTVQ